MWPFGRKNTRIRVRLTLEGSSEVAGEMALAPEQIPEDFATPGRSIAAPGGVYAVVSAEPATKEACIRARTLMLSVRKLPIIERQTFLHASSTLERASPATVLGDPSACVTMRKEEWRQLEFIHESLRPTVELEFEAITHIHQKCREDLGYTQSHLRDSIRFPLTRTGVPFEDLKRRFPSSAIRPLAFKGDVNVVKDGFTIEIGHACWLYGLNDRGSVMTLGVESRGDHAIDDVAALFAPDLMLVDWEFTEIVEPTRA